MVFQLTIRKVGETHIHSSITKTTIHKFEKVNFGIPTKQ